MSLQEIILEAVLARLVANKQRTKDIKMNDTDNTVQSEDLENELDQADQADQVAPSEDQEVSIQSLLEQKAELQGLADFAVEALLKKSKFNRKDIARAFRKVKTYIDFVDSFQELILHDLQIIDGRFRGIEENLFKVSQQQSILTAALKANNVVTDEQMVAAWNDIVKPTLENKIAELNKQVAEDAAVPAPANEVVTDQIATTAAVE